MTYMWQIMNSSTSILCRSRFLCAIKHLYLMHDMKYTTFNNIMCAMNNIKYYKLIDTNVSQRRTFFHVEYKPSESNIINPAIVSNLKEALYPNSGDALILKLNKCCSVQEVLNFLNDNMSRMNSAHACQALLVLWCIHKEFLEKYLLHLSKNDLATSLKETKDLFTRKLVSQKEFANILDIISAKAHSLTTDELSFCLYCLQKFNFPHEDDLIVNLIEIAEERMKSNSDEWNIRSLTKYTSSLKCKDTLRLAQLAKPTIPLILKHLDEVKDEANFRDVTVCLNNVRLLISKNTLEKHKIVLKNLLQNNVINCNSHETILTTIHFYNLLHWSAENIDEICDLVHLVKPTIPSMTPQQVVFLYNIYQIHLRPASILGEVKKKISSIWEEIKDDERINVYLTLPDLFFCQISTSAFRKRHCPDKLIMDALQLDIYSTYSSIYKTLRLLKSPNKKLSSHFWRQVLDSTLKTEDFEDELLNLCARYMYFNDNDGEHFRDYHFENRLLNEILILKDKSVGFVPWKMCRIAAFIVAYRSHHINMDEFNAIVEKTLNIIHQLKVSEILIFSKGIKIYFDAKNKHSSSCVNNHVWQINSELDKRTVALLNQHDLSLLDVSLLNKSYIYRHTNVHNDIFHRFLVYFDRIDAGISPRIINDTLLTFFMTKTIVPNFMDRAVDFVVDQNEDVAVSIVNKILTFSRYAGHTPKNGKFYECAMRTIETNRELLSAQSLLDSLISLCSFGYAREDVIKNIFSLDFMEKMDDEISVCYNRDKYPAKLRRLMMVLNRIICLDFPQFEIPWFHKKYTEEMESLSGSNTTIFFEDVWSNLINIVGRKELIKKSAFTPYGYKVDFLIELNPNGFPIVSNESNQRNVARKIAINLLQTKNFIKSFDKSVNEDGTETVFFKDVLKGALQMQTRHLELLGYSVIEIPIMFWNSMYMMEPKAKTNFLRNKIWPTKK